MDSTLWIEDLLRNNRSPSEEEAQEVKKMLLGPSKDSEVLHSEIMNLKNRLSELESRQSETGKQIARYETILSPIRRIPREVLGEIFYHCLPSHRFPTMASSDCPLLLTRVCSTWREAAMTTPKLWERLYITFTDQDTVPDLESLINIPRHAVNMDGWRYAQSKAAKDRTIELLRRRCEAVKEWLLRSGTRPLSISLKFTNTPWYYVPYSERPPSVTMDFLSLLASLAPRWRRFEIHANMNIYRVLDNMLPISHMTLLTSLQGDYVPKDGEIGGVGQPLRILNAPNLRRLSISVGDTKLWGLTERPLVQWSKLTHITCLHSFSLPETIFLLRNSSNLVHFKGTVMHYRVEDASIHEENISLPFLQSLSLNEHFLPSLATNIYDFIDAPKLQWITYFSYFNTADYTPDHSAPIPILPLLLRSTELRYFCVNGSDLNVWDIGAMLRAIPSVAHLAIGEEDSNFNPSFVPNLLYKNYDAALRQFWKFSELIVGASSNNLENDAPLLPRLTSLVISGLTARISDDTLLELIKSRMTSSGTATLSRVKGRFYREIQKDISTELTRYAELVGEKIDLDLMYAQPPLSDRSMAPQFGLKEMDEREPSWQDQHEDAGDVTYRWHVGYNDPFL